MPQHAPQSFGDGDVFDVFHAVSPYILKLNEMLPADATLDARTRTERVRQRSASRRQKSSVHDGLLRKLALKKRPTVERGL
jgi:hypothetical protein